MSASSPPYKGQCLCGAVSYEVDELQPRLGHCHCSMCRKFHGAAFATFGEAKPEHFRWTGGEQDLAAYKADNGTVRQFCRSCGSSLTFAPSSNPKGLVEFSLGTLDDDLPNRPDAHIFVNYKASWYDIADHLPRHGESRR